MSESASPFAKVETSVDFPALERQILKFWDENRIFEKRKAANAGKPRWSFLDGPITANNPMGVHHAWGRTYKDVYNRYFAMTGHELRYQNGFDCQGLWVEVEVEKDLKLKSKRDIENLVPGDHEASIAKFVQACKDRVNKFARVQTDQSIRLGYWMDWDLTDADWAKTPDERKSYFTMSEENNYTIWSFLKKCHGKKLIYRGYDVMPWCGRCGVGISEQEMKEGYRLVEHRSVFVKFPLKDRPGENLLVWTTTPWTLTSNVGAAVNPELTYLKVKLKDEVYYVAKGAFKLNRMESAGDEDSNEPEASARGGKKRDWLEGVPHLSSIEQHFKSKAGKGDSYEIVGEVKGSELLGLEYVGPFDDLPAQQHAFGFPDEVAQIVQQRGWCPTGSTAAASHRVIDGGKDVTEAEGTGIVHTAPGCGGIDFGWGKQHGLPPVAPLNESGEFLEGFGPLTGKVAYVPETAEAVFEELKKKDRLFTTERYVHRYPHCWRCKTELLYRLVDEWFINMGEKPRVESGAEVWKKDEFRTQIKDVVQKVEFLPESINGKARETDWLRNMGDWMISKKRYWGLCLPIWVDEKDPTDFEVIGSREELKERAVEGWPEFDGHTPHRPWIDKVKIRNPRTGNLMTRIPDVGNPWLDAGIVGFSTLKYNADRAYWDKWYPADFITESFPGQFRNWFYALLALSTMMSDGKPPFRTLLGHGNVKDQYGHEMHKTAGNSIEFIAAADEGGVIADPKGNKVPFKAIGADVMRWLYCRHNPASGLNFGPEPADEVRSKLFFKLWNTYSFFVTCATGDGFSPDVPQVPVKERPDFDRWLLSSLQSLVKEAKPAFENYNVMAFALAAEKFIDEHLSNWYVRRNKDRFWSKTADLDAAGKQDKLAAYQTLYTTLTTLCKLLAPCIPFVTEAIWRNLRMSCDSESVHLSDYPNLRDSVFVDLRDENDDLGLQETTLLNTMTGLMNIVTHAMNLRKQSKVKTRQPLSTLIVSPSFAGEKRALTQFAEQLRDELNVKSILIHEGPNELLVRDFKPNIKKIREYFREASHDILTKLNQNEYAVEQSGGRNIVTVIASNGTKYGIPDDAIYDWSAPAEKSGWACLSVPPGPTQLLLDISVTPNLKLEGLARDVIRQVQDARKTAGLDMLDKIALHLDSPSAEITNAIDAHRSTIATAVQANEWLPAAEGHATTAKIDGQPLTIALRKVV